MARHIDMIRVNGKKILTPSVFDLSRQDISAADAGRTQDTIMHKNQKGRKIKISLAWNGVNPTEAHQILKAFEDEYFRVTYYDPWEGDTVTKTFYSGDQSAPVKMWTVNKKMFTQVSFDIIER